MRRNKLLPVSAAALLFAQGAVAQTDEGQGEGETPAATESGEIEVEQKGGTPPVVTGSRETAPGEAHTVTKGDTLWDLSQRYLGSPWYWPKVWSYNPEIANPHWIYPGNQVRFFPTGEEVPAQVGVQTPPPAEDDAMDAPEFVDDDDNGPGITVVKKIGYDPKSAVRVVTTGFLTAKELEEAGAITGSFSEAQMLSYPDTAYVKFKKQTDAKVGDRYVVFKTIQKIKHPVNGGDFGYLTHFLGSVKITAVDETTATADVVATWDEVNRGDLIGPFNERLSENISPRPNEKALKGYVVTAMIPYLTMTGEHHHIMIDKGAADGVQPGNVFTVVRRSDLGGDLWHPEKQDKKYPLEDVGQCMAIDVKDKATTCLLVRSIREIVPGDSVEMRVPGQSAPLTRR